MSHSLKICKYPKIRQKWNLRLFKKSKGKQKLDSGVKSRRNSQNSDGSSEGGRTQKTCQYYYKKYCKNDECEYEHLPYKGFDIMIYCGHVTISPTSLHWADISENIYSSDGIFFHTDSNIDTSPTLHLHQPKLALLEKKILAIYMKSFKQYQDCFYKYKLIKEILCEDLVRDIIKHILFYINPINHQEKVYTGE